jgi:hypothetical protein
MATKKSPTSAEKYVIARGTASGVHAGILVSRTGSEVTLRQARRLWYWIGAASLSQLAVAGTRKPDSCKFPAAVPGETIKTDVCELIDCTDVARRSIKGVPEWQA